MVKTLKLAGLTNIQQAKIVKISAETKSEIGEQFKMTTDINIKVVEIGCKAANFESGSSQPLSFAKKVQQKQNETEKSSTSEKNAVWSLADLDDDERSEL